MRTSLSIRRILISGTAFAAVTCAGSGAAWAQSTPEEIEQATAQDEENDGTIIVTGSRIRQDPNDSALPLQIITTQELSRNSISSPEQLLSFLTNNGSSADNLASNSDVVTAERRGNNGASFANLRGQGPAATLVLLNGRRVSSHGTTGSAVDVNQIPFAAIERVEVLKDGASAIYGTDAIGGVINFITRSNYQGVGASAFTDFTDEGDSTIYRLSGIAGYGDLNEQGFNVMGTVGYSSADPLFAKERDFVNTFQNDRGLGVDTRGTPFATIVNLAGTAFPTSSSFPLIPGTTTRATGGINLLRLPGGPGCDAVDDMDIYDTQVWNNPSNGLTCSFDTGKNVYLQQQLETITYLGRGVVRLGGRHEAFAEITGSHANSEKRFSQIQLLPNTTTQNYAYDLVPGVNDDDYNQVYNTLNAAFPTLAIPYGSSFSYRWRCMECDERSIETTTDTLRIAAGVDGPLFSDWDYRVGASYAQSESSSQLGTGYYYQAALVAALNSGNIDPFLFPGETQSEAGLNSIRAASAEGVVLYGGKYSVQQVDASISGGLFDLPGGRVKFAAGVDFRREEYSFTGDERVNPTTIIGAPFDNGNVLDNVSRDIKAVYAEVLIPVFEGFELSAAGRIDDYSGFGTTTNPKISVKYRPWQPIMIRGSYNTAFRVPAFNQLFNPQVEALYTGADYADPRDCPNGQINEATGCVALTRTIDLISGGNPDLEPETAEGWSAGVVLEPMRNFSLSVDWWRIRRDNRIGVVALRDLVLNYEIFEDRFIRDSSGTLTDIVQVNDNVGTGVTEGIDITARGSIEVGPGAIAAGIDGTYLLTKNEQVNAAAPVTDQLGVYSLASDLGLEWKHNAFIAYGTDDWSVSLTQIFRSGYKNQQLPGIAAGAFDPPNDVVDVEDYIIYNLSASYTGIPGFKLTAGVKNLFDTDPPFAISYDSNNGSGSSWEPRVADPRGRSFTILAEVNF